MTTPLTVADVLERAADLIEPEGAWTQGVWARTTTGRACGPFEDGAACFCMRGALNRVSGRSLVHDMADIRAVLGFPTSASMARWNDRENRTQAEVVAKLREAATLARSQTPNTDTDGEAK